MVRLLSLGFGAAAGMWFFSYLAMLQPGAMGGDALFGCSVLALFAGGVLSGRLAGNRPAAVEGLFVGLIVAIINLLLVASLLKSDMAGGGLWIASILVGCLCVGALGGLIGGAMGPLQSRERWTSIFCWVATAVTFFMIVTGGVVTGFEAGLAVPDWPNSYGHNMLLYPLSEMVADLHSGIFYEHAHRLTGMFVGFTSVTLCCVLFANDRRAWVRVLGVVILIMVISQGVLGGLRVTGVLTFSQDPSILSPSTAFAIVHGVFAHVIMATMAVAATATSNRWLDGGHKGDSAAPVDLKIATGLVNVLLLQLAIGAAYRHLAAESALGAREGQAMALLMVHVTVAIIVAIMAIATGIQGTVRGGVLRRMGFVLLTLVVLQLLLGVGAVVGVYVPEPAADTGAIPAWAVLLTSAHQANGALLLMAAAVMAAWAGRLALRSSSVQPDEPASASPPPA